MNEGFIEGTPNSSRNNTLLFITMRYITKSSAVRHNWEDCLHVLALGTEEGGTLGQTADSKEKNGLAHDQSKREVRFSVMLRLDNQDLEVSERVPSPRWLHTTEESLFTSLYLRGDNCGHQRTTPLLTTPTSNRKTK